MKKESKRILGIVTFFAIAMAFLETAVVIYLRYLFYPGGFAFPLKGFLNPAILSVEWIREFATIIMLVGISFLAAKKFYGRLAYFLYAFAIWDIFYYIFLKLVLNWPSSFFSWDLLFLIPWPWIGPVLAPVICSILFIIFAVRIINLEDDNKKVKLQIKEWTLFILGAILVLYSWLYDYGTIIFGGKFARSFFTLAENPQFMKVISEYSPAGYNWIIFSIGIILTIVGIGLFYTRTKKSR